MSKRSVSLRHRAPARDRRRAAPSWIAATVGALAMANQVGAFEPTRYLSYSYGPFSLRPRVTVSESYNDNVYYRSEGPAKKGDFVSSVGAGFAMSLGRRPELDPFNFLGGGDSRNYVGLDYTFANNFYSQEDVLNGDSHTLMINNQLSGNRLSLKGSDQIEMATSVLGGGINYGRVTTRSTFIDSYRLNYALSPKTRLYAVGSHTTTDYEKNTPLYDSSTLSGTLGFGLAALPKTAFFGETYYGQSSVGPNRPEDRKGPHENYMGGFIGAQGTFTPRLSGLVKAGYEAREFSDKTPAPGSPVVGLQLSYRIGEKTRTTLNYTRSGSVSVQTTGEAVTYDTVTWRLDQSFGATRRWTASVGTTYQLGTFQSNGYFANRNDDWLQANLSLSYLIRLWMKASMNYEFEDFKSNASNKGIIDYTANRITLRLTVGY